MTAAEERERIIEALAAQKVIKPQHRH